ncbi:DUF2059 domain-containing protein [Massilia sp. YIM B02769]|uniref:DUF2059 domain-containing protein n=1 Tax=Massilia sp. YIM B02769 TaxID=3050129 RepID=UPI0025B6AB60|nr:DUF2059 domain-containing protein [Massilia sp. YIM B02769]MDN4059400.1 DUF2059 domain-containing protein [Massilia sp. YIM B02769]
MKKFLVAFASVIALSGAAPAVLAAPAAPAAPAAAGAVDPQISAAVRAMFEAMKYRDIMKATFAQMEVSLPQNMRAGAIAAVNADPKLDAKAKQAKLAEMEKAVPQIGAALHTLFSDPGLMEEMLDALVPIYARTYTLDEVRQMSAFYQSPVGQKMLATTPQLMGEGMAISNQIMAPRINKLMQSLTKDAKK